MRDLIITMIVMAGALMALSRPHIGLYLWSWLSYMNPHRFSWGFAYSMPFVQVAAITTLVGMFFSGHKVRLPRSPLVWVWAAFVAWQVVTTFAAIDYDISHEGMVQSLKIQAMILATLLIIQTRQQLDGLVWVIALSIGFFGIKGGVFTILTGGQFRVWGPPESFIEGNNEIALALIIILPLLRYLQMEAKSVWVRRALIAAMLLCSASIVASYSRGAFLAGSAMTLFLILKSSRRVPLLLGVLVVIPLMLSMMPKQWFERMSTIENYQEDGSAMGRINAWYFAINLANDHPITGGGFRTFRKSLFLIYAPDPEDFHDAHSIYFEVLGEQGYVGLFLFLSIWLGTWLKASRIIRRTREDPGLDWAGNLASMCQVALVGYGTGGAFLGLAYFDLPYHIMAMIIVLDEIVRRQQREQLVEASPSGGQRERRRPE